MKQTPEGSPPRHGRKALFVRVATWPGLMDCWSVNLSVTGIGLIANPRSPREGPREGERIRLEFTLPDSGARVHAEGRVRWRHDAPGLLEGSSAALGVIFERFEGSEQVLLARYLAHHQLSVAVGFATPEEIRELRGVLEPDVQVLTAPDGPGLEALLSRGDVAAVVLCGEMPEAALVWAENAGHPRATGAFDAPAALAPRVVVCLDAPAEVLLDLFNRGKVHRALPRPLRPETMREVVLQACGEHGMRIEQHRMALELDRQVRREKQAPRLEAASTTGRGPGFGSRGMREVMELLRVAAPHRIPVLLQGETGTGKEVLARTLHELSDRAAAPFIVQDCGALTETLLDSELFGHVKGAFTGAVAEHPGLFVLADRGTIFLDEIENTTPNFQAKLLRVIETGDVRPVGGTQVRHVDVRVVAASNQHLGVEVEQRRFRSDLFFRLNTFTLDVPPLRERSEDVLALALHFVSLFNERLGRTVTGIDDEAQRALSQARWPGNVRELRNVIERAVLLARPGEPLTVRHLPSAFGHADARLPATVKAGSLKAQLESLERTLIQDALARHGGVLRRAALELQTDPVTFARRAKRHGLKL